MEADNKIGDTRKKKLNKMYSYVVLLTSLKHQHHSDCSLLAGVEDPNASPNISSMIAEV